MTLRLYAPLLLLLASPLRLPAQEPAAGEEILIESRSLEALPESRTVIYEKDVSVEYPAENLWVDCDKLVVVRKVAGDPEEAAPEAPGEGGMALEKIVAEGQVRIRRKNLEGEMQIALAGRAILNPETKIVTLVGWPELYSGPQHLKATSEGTLIYLLENGRHKVEGPAATRLVPVEERPAEVGGDSPEKD
ncbi:MAG: hypothetical protein AAF555_07750 [Verrucomicrobiota bacterium]